MGKIFDLDGPVIRFLNKVADLMWLNILTMICCVPLITAGASFTAMHYMALKIVRNEECYITRGFFKSFKENFRQSTILWLIMLVMAAFFATDFYIIKNSGLEFGKVFTTLLTMLAVMTLFTAVMIFPIQAKFGNPVAITIKNSFVVAILQFPKTFAMIILKFFPIAIIYISLGLFPIAFVFGFSLPAYLSAQLYNKTFLRMEKQFEERQEAVQETDREAGQEDSAEEEQRIFRDESSVQSEREMQGEPDMQSETSAQ